MNSTALAAAIFVENRRTNHTVDSLPAELRPRDLAAAYAIQQAVVERLIEDHGGRVAGYKIACTNESAQQLLNIDAPLFGRLLSSFVHASPARITASDYHVRVIETEYAFQMGSDVPPQEMPYTRQSIAEFVSAVLPSIEIVNHHFTDWTRVGGFVLAADNAIHGAWVHGKPKTNWHNLDLESDEVRLTVNRKRAAVGCGGNVLGHPLAALAWLANELPKFNLSLKAGDYVTTGTAADVYAAQPGDRIMASFGRLGRVELSVE